MNVLIVEDQAINRRLLHAQLAARDIKVFEACDGVEALDVLRRERIDAIISDILMPKMDGYRLCYEIRLDAALQAIPIIIYTATYTSPSDERVAFELGADYFLRKPASVEDLNKALDRVQANPRSAARPSSAPEEGLTRMKAYSERLVEKLEEKNLELEKVRDALRDANASLEQRVRERTAELEAANTRLESFAFFVSHELRSPLRSIDGFASILREKHAEALTADGQRLLATVERSAGQMGRLIEDLLRFCRLGRQPLTLGEVDVRALVEGVIAELQPTWEPRGVAISVGELPPCRGDAALLRQVFLNLLGNALKFTQRRSDAQIEIGSRLEGETRVGYVRDNGVGFDMKYAGKLFAAFERLPSAQGFEGSGLGLGIVQNILQRHGGRIWAEGTVGKGATFYFVLPWLETPAMPGATAAAA